MSNFREKIANAKLKASISLSSKELNGRDRVLYYRLKDSISCDPKLGVYSGLTAWSSACYISPNPIIEDVSSKFIVEKGIIKIGDIKVSINTPGYEKTDLENYEYALKEGDEYIEYSLIGGSGVIQDKNKSYWILYLRRKQ